VPSQIPLPLEPRAAMSRADFVVTPVNEAAAAFVDSWPNWPVTAAALCGLSGSGKTHLIEAWKERSAAQILAASSLNENTLAAIDRARPIAIEDVDSAAPSAARDHALFQVIEGATSAILLTGREAARDWPTVLPDLGARFSALLCFTLWAPDDALLAALARKLFADRKLVVPEQVIVRMIRGLERSPTAIREFVALADAKALAEGRAINDGLVRELLSATEMRQG
jgi:chromosomal replication initiation ATPase DnaA